MSSPIFYQEKTAGLLKLIGKGVGAGVKGYTGLAKKMFYSGAKLPGGGRKFSPIGGLFSGVLGLPGKAADGTKKIFKPSGMPSLDKV